MATPAALVTTVVGPHAMADAPVVGRMKLTATPGTPTAVLLGTCTCSRVEKNVLMLALCESSSASTIEVGTSVFAAATGAVGAVGAVATTLLWAVPHDGAEAASPEYDPRTVAVAGRGPVQLATPLEMVAVHSDPRPAENTTVPVGPAEPATVAE